MKKRNINLNVWKFWSSSLHPVYVLYLWVCVQDEYNIYALCCFCSFFSFSWLVMSNINCVCVWNRWKTKNQEHRICKQAEKMFILGFVWLFKINRWFSTTKRRNNQASLVNKRIGLMQKILQQTKPTDRSLLSSSSSAMVEWEKTTTTNCMVWFNSFIQFLFVWLISGRLFCARIVHSIQFNLVQFGSVRSTSHSRVTHFSSSYVCHMMTTIIIIVIMMILMILTGRPSWLALLVIIMVVVHFASFFHFQHFNFSNFVFFILLLFFCQEEKKQSQFFILENWKNPHTLFMLLFFIIVFSLIWFLIF